MNKKTLCSVIALFTFSLVASAEVRVEDNQLVLRGAKQPQLFGAEVQYFRLRGGYGRNVPREKVISLWNRTLDQFVAAKMNAISFYVPWDFHEYAPGKFDFDGTADEDGDGNADYPSRDVLTFLKMIEARGIKHVMVRPGPYINAEWGFLGFGAIPEWFHDAYPDSHMRASTGERTKLYDYHNPDLLRHSRLWLKAVYERVVKKNLSPRGAIDFIQVDNETNYLWQSIYNHDYGPRAVNSYRLFLKKRYRALAAVNKSHERNWRRWDEILPPAVPGKNLGEDQDWYRYHDESIHSYLCKLRKIWESFGVREPQVIFTLAESYNAAPQGLLPNYLLRNHRNKTGLLTVNLYPKTFELPHKPITNTPFKADLDVKAATVANAYYWGRPQEWAMGPEIQGGWWRGIEVSAKSRRQTYLTVLGHGLKAFFIYYFNEGDNFGAHWAHDQATELYRALRHDQDIPKSVPMKDLPDSFWTELQRQMNHKTTLGFYPRNLLMADLSQEEKLFFDAPLDGDANPRPHFDDLRDIGNRVIAPHQDFLGRSLAVQDDIAIVKDVASHVPNAEGFDSVLANADWAGGLLGYLLTNGLNPRVLISEVSRFSDAKAFLHIDTGVNEARTLSGLKKAVAANRTVVNFLAGGVAAHLNYPRGEAVKGLSARVELTAYVGEDGSLLSGPTDTSKELSLSAAAPLYTYGSEEIARAGCQPVLFLADSRVAGYRCGNFWQLGALLFDDFNSSAYGQMEDFSGRRAFLAALLSGVNFSPNLVLGPEADRLAVFARHDPKKEILWITAKSGSAKEQSTLLRLNDSLLLSPDLSVRYAVRDLLNGGNPQLLSGRELVEKGFRVSLEGDGSTVYTLTKLE